MNKRERRAKKKNVMHERNVRRMLARGQAMMLCDAEMWRQLDPVTRRVFGGNGETIPIVTAHVDEFFRYPHPPRG